MIVDMNDQSQVVFVYLDNLNVPSQIESIVGNIKFGSITQGKKNIKELVVDFAESLDVSSFVHVEDTAVDQIQNQLLSLPENSLYVFLSAKNVILDGPKLKTVISSAKLGGEDGYSNSIDPSFAVLNGKKKTIQYIQKRLSVKNLDFTDLFENSVKLPIENAFIDLSKMSHFLEYMTSGLNTRHFNQIENHGVIITKKSADKKKIKSEYQNFSLIPDKMKRWFVQPFNYVEGNEIASYDMERLNCPELAILWISNSFKPQEFREALDRVFLFLEERPSKEVSSSEYREKQEQLYKSKLRNRFDSLKTMKEFDQIDNLIKFSTKYSGLEEIINEYENLFDKHIGKLRLNKFVIGHGDLCFSNILYDKNTKFLKLIDPKGALEEADLWTDYYYDLAKLSHSILGFYDFVNKELFEIHLDEKNMMNLSYDSNNLEICRNIFKEKVDSLGADMFFVRLFESSLFLSMLPLHIDKPQKVMGYILTAINILEELKLNER